MHSMAVNYNRVVLAPHLDDAPLSCGGAIHRWSAAGERVLVVTLMTGDPSVGESSPFAETLHAAWQLSAAEAYSIRRGEELAAMHLLGADFSHLGFLDCIYRRWSGGYLYSSEEALFGEVHPADAPLLEEMVKRLKRLAPLAEAAAVYAPLALGNHVDHQLVRWAAKEWRPDLSYYEDYPYAEEVDIADVMPTGEPTLQPLAEQDVQAKIQAIGCYQSQVGILFGGQPDMEVRVWQFCRRNAQGEGLAERFWLGTPVNRCSLDVSP
jgi:LmbE family N-acetylglucosaminyl deacetylase